MNEFDKDYMDYHLSGCDEPDETSGSGGSKSGCCLPPVVVGILFFIGMILAAINIGSS